MKNAKGVIGIIVLIVVALVIGGGVTYWYVQKDIPKAQGFDIKYNEVLKDGGDVPYQPIVKPEPKPVIEPKTFTSTSTGVAFQYPGDWQADVMEDPKAGFLIIGPDHVDYDPYWIFLTPKKMVKKDEQYTKKCFPSEVMAIQGVDVIVSFLCEDRDDSNDVLMSVDTQTGYILYGGFVIGDPSRPKETFLDAFKLIASSLKITPLVKK